MGWANWFPINSSDPPVNTARGASVTSSPALPRTFPSYVAVPYVNSETGWRNDSAYEVDFVVIEVPSSMFGVTWDEIKTYACARALASDPKYRSWHLGSVKTIEKGLVLKSYNYDELFDDH